MENKQINGIQEMIKKKKSDAIDPRMGNKDRLFFRSVTGTEKSLPHLFFNEGSW